MHRVLFFTGQPYEIYSYGFFLVLAMAFGVSLCIKRGPRFGVTRDQVLDCALATLLGGMIGGRVFSVIYDWDIYAREPFIQVFNIRGGGLAWHGALMGGVLGFMIYRFRSGIATGRLLDLMTPGAILGHVIGRIGCFLNGCCVGRPTTVPWAVTFPDAPEWGCEMRHPTQIYEALAELAMLLFLTLWWERRPRPSGSLFYLYMGMYGAARFFIEFVRQEPLLAGGLDLAQYISFGMIAIGIAGLAWGARHPHPSPEDVEVTPAGA